jgi:hypothetical protein
MDYDDLCDDMKLVIGKRGYDDAPTHVKQMLIEDAEYVLKYNMPNITRINDPNTILFEAVGMRYYTNHVFTPNDDITVEKEDDNPHDSNAIKIMVDGVKVAYVSRRNTSQLRNVEGLEHKKIECIMLMDTSTLLAIVND